MTPARQRLFLLALFVALTLAAVAPIQNYDLFWHLATGRWILEHRALPATDPFAVASDGHEWINGEWLFQIAIHPLQTVIGLSGLSIVRGLLAALLFTFVYVAARRHSNAHVALLLSAIGFAGAMATFDVRPSSIGIFFVAAAMLVGERYTRLPDRSRLPLMAVALLTIAWINIHPSALLAPAVFLLASRRVLPAVISALALFVNPYGVRGVLAPIELTAYATSGEFVNAEWLPSSPLIFPLLYICMIGGLLALTLTPNEETKVARWARLLLFLMFAWLAVRHVRNQGIFFAAFPLLVAPMLGPHRVRVPRIAAIAGAVLAIGFIAATTDHRLGVAPERFPLTAVSRLKATNFGGNIYNPDQFGGFLIWSFYPERRALTDGRNELYRTYIAEYANALGDERAWRQLLRKYSIDLAVEEYRPPLEVIDAATGQRRHMPASLAYWPRARWALIAFDEAAMVFARRDAFPREELEKWEIRGVVPDALR